jgi:hypothetical protein
MADPPEPKTQLRLVGDWPETIGGRPSLAELGEQTEELVRSILELPYDKTIYRGDDRSYLAAELKTRLIPRLAVAPLGRHRDVFRHFFFGGATSDRNLYLLANVGREDVLQGTDLLEADEIRDTVLRLIYEAVATSVQETWGRRAQEAPSEHPTSEDHRGRVRLHWGENEGEDGPPG